MASEADLVQLLTSTKPNSLVVVKFSAALCKASKEVEAKFEQTAAKFGESGAETGVRFAKVNLESNRQLFDKMGIRSVPHVQVRFVTKRPLLSKSTRWKVWSARHVGNFTCWLILLLVQNL